MNPISAFAVYFIIWWTSLFAILSLGLRTQEESGEIVPGTHASAPGKPRLLRIFGLNTLIATSIFAGFYWFAVIKGLRFDDLANHLPSFMTVPTTSAP